MVAAAVSGIVAAVSGVAVAIYQLVGDGEGSVLVLTPAAPVDRISHIHIQGQAK